MKTLIAGAAEPVEAVATLLAPEGIEVDACPPDGEGAGIERLPALAASLLALERRMTAERPQLVLLADGGDHALAAALVATKLLVPLARLGEDEDSGHDAGENGRLLDLLAETVRIEALPTLLRP